MSNRIRVVVVAGAVLAAALVLGATIADAIRQDSWGPIWMIGWLPAVLVGAFYRPAAKRYCIPRRVRRTPS